MNKSDIKILVVADELNNLDVLSEALTNQGYRLQHVNSGELALQEAIACPPDLILLDVIMPQMDGYAVCQKLKEKPETCEIPVIFLSPLQETEAKVKAFQVGGVD